MRGKRRNAGGPKSSIVFGAKQSPYLRPRLPMQRKWGSVGAKRWKQTESVALKRSLLDIRARPCLPSMSLSVPNSMLRSDEMGKDLSMKEMLEQERQKLVGYLRQAQKVGGSCFVRRAPLYGSPSIVCSLSILLL